jgi:predicted alpha/beta superfamily hydrolase
VKKESFLILLGLLFYGLNPLAKAQSTTTFIIESLPSNTPADASIYMVGSFNNWNPADPNYELQLNINNQLYTTVSGSGSMLFKFTRGSWGQVEGNQNGGFLPDRSFQFGSTDTLYITIQSWEDLGGTAGSTANEQVSILSSNFFIPQLNRSRRIWIYLPPDYQTETDKHYPVLYMHDGQNLFDATTSFSGEWEVDESLTDLWTNENDYGCIVVGIDNGGVHRIAELTPWANAQYGGGDGSLYIDFIVETLKPYVDDNYRTFSDRNSTAIGGSSLGGLISYYGLFNRPEVFSKALVFSPSFWFNLNELNNFNNNIDFTEDYRLVLLGGQNEGGSMAANINAVESFLLENNFPESELLKQIDADGAHSEWYWRREFPDAYQWLFENYSAPVSVQENLAKTADIKIFPNPAREIITIEVQENWLGSEAIIYNVLGKKVTHFTIKEKLSSISVEPFVGGTYILQIKNRNGMQFTESFLKN